MANTNYDLLNKSGGYETLVAQYRAALQAWEAKARPYFEARQRDAAEGKYTSQHPPKYNVPKKPKDPNDKDPIPDMREILARVAQSAKTDQRLFREMYGFVPQKSDESTFKKLYAQEAQRAGIPPEVIRGIYAYETAGNGKSTEQPINSGSGGVLSTALGPAQLLNPNSVEMMAEHGHEFAAKLDERGDKALATIVRAMHRDAAQVKSDFAAFKASGQLPKYVSDDIERSSVTREKFAKGLEPWDFYKTFAKTDKGRAMHLANLDGRIGGMMQTQKLLDEMKVHWDPKQNALVDNQSGKPLPASVLRDPVAWEMRNLLGGRQAEAALRPENRDKSTGNFVDMKGYGANAALHDKSAGQLADSMRNTMNSYLNAAGSREFAAIYQSPDVRDIKPSAPPRVAQVVAATSAGSAPQQSAAPTSSAQAAPASEGWGAYFSFKTIRNKLGI